MAAASSFGTKVKTNERPGTRAQVRYVRMSASKVRVILNLIRGKHVVEADQILAFSERLAAQVIGKCLRSAVANALNNDEIPTEELYISACYADEGPTLKRFRPRARGRAGRIHKQTCHITIVVSRYDEEELDARRHQAELRGESSGRNADASAARARRVAKSRNEDPEDTEQTTDAEDTDLAATEVAEDTVTAEVVEDTVDEVTDDAASSDEERSDDDGGDA
ncbi:MAG: 50S ribosomal protein L22 [Actinomycetia bacterium]|nr:50S ribosomal protein L22 [Actinomycetes bacterium]MCP5033656.1 50S ribosomal protein L22 [Actinomycetes bacterium]